MRFLFSCEIVLLAVLFASSCATRPVNVPPEASPEKIIQWAQEASDRNRYNTALRYYEILLERNLTNTDLVCAAEYEIAFIHYKQKKYDQARAEFNALLERYDTPDAELLPQEYKILALIVLENIKAKEEKRPLFLSPKKAGEENRNPETPAEAG
jgi:tetratricopeptide (TPR) repeat protein